MAFQLPPDVGRMNGRWRLPARRPFARELDLNSCRRSLTHVSGIDAYAHQGSLRRDPKDRALFRRTAEVHTFTATRQVKRSTIWGLMRRRKGI
jgi:hypothetical protein